MREQCKTSLEVYRSSTLASASYKKMRGFVGFSAVALCVYIALVRGTWQSLQQPRQAPLPDVAQLLAGRQRRRQAAASAASTRDPPASLLGSSGPSVLGTVLQSATPSAAEPPLETTPAEASAPVAATPPAFAGTAATRQVGAGLQLDFGPALGVVRLHLRREWSPSSTAYASAVAEVCAVYTHCAYAAHTPRRWRWHSSFDLVRARAGLRVRVSQPLCEFEPKPDPDSEPDQAPSPSRPGSASRPPIASSRASWCRHGAHAWCTCTAYAVCMQCACSVHAVCTQCACGVHSVCIRCAFGVHAGGVCSVYAGCCRAYAVCLPETAFSCRARYWHRACRPTRKTRARPRSV